MLIVVLRIQLKLVIQDFKLVAQFKLVKSYHVGVLCLWDQSRHI